MGRKVRKGEKAHRLIGQVSEGRFYKNSTSGCEWLRVLAAVRSTVSTSHHSASIYIRFSSHPSIYEDRQIHRQIDIHIDTLLATFLTVSTTVSTLSVTLCTFSVTFCNATRYCCSTRSAKLLQVKSIVRLINQTIQ